MEKKKKTVFKNKAFVVVLTNQGHVNCSLLSLFAKLSQTMALLLCTLIFGSSFIIVKDTESISMTKEESKVRQARKMSGNTLATNMIDSNEEENTDAAGLLPYITSPRTEKESVVPGGPEYVGVDKIEGRRERVKW